MESRIGNLETHGKHYLTLFDLSEGLRRDLFGVCAFDKQARNFMLKEAKTGPDAEWSAAAEGGQFERSSRTVGAV